MESLFRNKIFLVVIALVVAGAVWFGLSSSPVENDLVSTPTSVSGPSVDQGIVSTLLALRAVKLDGTMFKDPAFILLKDFSTEIIPEPVGRTNPFAPLSAQSRLPPRSTTSPQTVTPPRR